jgi:hypothetical protein
MMSSDQAIDAALSRLRRCFVAGSSYSALDADAAAGAEAGVCNVSSGASDNGWPVVSGTSPASDAATGFAGAFDCNGAMLAGRAGAGGIVGMYNGPRWPHALRSEPADIAKAATIALIRKTARITVPE